MGLLFYENKTFLLKEMKKNSFGAIISHNTKINYKCDKKNKQNKLQFGKLKLVKRIFFLNTE